MPLRYFGVKEKAAIWAMSLATGFILILYPVFTGLYVPTPPYFIPLDITSINFVLAGMLISIIGPGVVEYMNYRWVREAERGLATMFGGLASTIRSGLTITRGMEVVEEMTSKPLAREIKRTVLRLQMGMDFEEAVRRIGEEYGSPRISMANLVLIEAARSGGLIAEVLDSARKLYETYNEYDDEKATNLKPYGLVLYVSIFIFIAVSYLLIHQFLVPLVEVTREAGAPFLAMMGSVSYYKALLYYSSFIESLLSGLVIGKLAHGSVKCGLRHSVVLCLATMLIFNFIV